MQTPDTPWKTGSRKNLQRKIFQSILTGRCARVLGPRYMGKSQLIQEVVEQVRGEYSPYVSYQTLESYKHAGWNGFFTRLMEQIRKDVLPNQPAADAPPACTTALDLQQQLYHLMKQCDQNLVIFIDDLEIAPPNLIASLLGVIRALYMVSFSQPGARFLAVVTTK